MKQILFRVYPFLIASYPILALRNFNIVYVDLASIVRSLLIAFFLTGLIWLILFVVFRDRARSGIAASLAVVIIFSYGHIHIQSAALFGEPIRHSYLATGLAALYISLVWLAGRSAESVNAAQNFLAVAATVLVLMSLGQSLYYDIAAYRTTRALAEGRQEFGTAAAVSEYPDIYLIVLDSHGRADRILEKYGYDSSGFVEELEALGFYVAKCSQSNYASTLLSLSSLFGMNYIPTDLGGSAKLPPLSASTLAQSLTSLGYTIISFENRASGHFDLQEDIRLSQNQLVFGNLNLGAGLNEFEDVLLRTTLAKLFWDTELIPGFSEETMIRLENYEHYQQTMFILSELGNLPKMKSPKFVLIHIMVPHSPFVFTADGDFKRIEDKSRNGYRDNVAFIDRRILTSVQALLAASDQPPVIVLMGDHGPPPGKYASREDRISILNAVLASDEVSADLYDSITPVNTFRIISNHYFNGSNDLLDDTTYFAYKLGQVKNAPVVENTCESPR